MDSRITSMVKLLDDPEPEIYETVRRDLIKEGEEALPALLAAMDDENLSDFHLDRIKDVVQDINNIGLKKEFRDWLLNRSDNVLYGAYLINKIRYPNINYQTIENEVNAITNRIKSRLNLFMSGLQQIRVFNNLLYRHEKFSGNFKDTAAPQNAFLSDIFLQKKGNHASMALLYMAIGQKLGLPLHYVDFPRNSLLAFVDSRSSEVFNAKDVLFYINPFNGGAVVTRTDINNFFKMHKIKPEKEFYLPADNSLLVARLLRMLRRTYKAMGYFEKVRTVSIVLKAFK